MNCFGGCNSWIIILILICLFCDNGVGFANNGSAGSEQDQEKGQETVRKERAL